jgi:hypothetical protein
VRPGRLVGPVQPGGNYPDIELTKKHSDVQRGIEPIYQEAIHTPPPQGPGKKTYAASAREAHCADKTTGSTSPRRRRVVHSRFRRPGALSTARGHVQARVAQKQLEVLEASGTGEELGSVNLGLLAVQAVNQATKPPCSSPPPPRLLASAGGLASRSFKL